MVTITATNQTASRKIIHVDMDCFYAAVEVKYRPELRGKPLGVGGPANSRGVLTTASYEARKFGVRSAMPSSRAVKLCPQLILIPPNFALYKKESRAVREIFKRFTDKIEPLSLDEAYLDVSDAENATQVARDIRAAIQEELHLTASAGIAPNKFLAKIASDWRKPNGQFTVRPEHVAEFVLNLPVEKIWGVGQVTAKKLHERGLKTCGDIQKQSVAQLCQWFGSRGQTLSDLAHGIDSREVSTDGQRKSLTVEETYNQDLTTLQECLRKLPELYADWEGRMHRSGDSDLIRGFIIKLRFFDFKRTTHEVSARRWPRLEDFEKLLCEAWNRREDPVRLIGLGVRMGRPEPDVNTGQLRLFQ
ncbi:MAG: DNA polymerase IV [Bdellovibrionales bacterium]